MQTKKVRVLRPFYYNRQLQTKNALVELPSVFASEMMAAQKAEPVAEPASQQASVSDADHGNGKKEKTNAGK